jgi:hypothetical protein
MCSIYVILLTHILVIFILLNRLEIN